MADRVAESAIRRANEKQAQGDLGGNEIAQSLALLKHEGTLLKKAKSKAQPAQPRWFRLQDGVLYYYTDAEHNEPINWITLDAQVGHYSRARDTQTSLYRR